MRTCNLDGFAEQRGFHDPDFGFRRPLDDPVLGPYRAIATIGIVSCEWNLQQFQAVEQNGAIQIKKRRFVRGNPAILAKVKR
ncbi:hypothetical protein D1872_300240 [compost metagenome]